MWPATYASPPTLADALLLVRQRSREAGELLCVGLACGFEPLHLKTFLAASLGKRLPARRIEIAVGLYGDLAGNVRRLQEVDTAGAVVAVEWADLDPRLGLRSPRGWRLAQLPDICATITARLDVLREAIGALAAEKTVAVSLPTLPLPPIFPTPVAGDDPAAMELRQRLAAFAAAIAAEPGVRVVASGQLDRFSPPGARLDAAAEHVAGFPYTTRHAAVLAELVADLLFPRLPKKGVISDLDDTLWRGILGEDGVENVAWDLDHQALQHAIYQGMLASLSDVGVLIGVATKNDAALVEKALERKDLILPRNAIFPVEASWGLKSAAVTAILKTWNIGPESVIFIDDSPLELAEVAAVHPEIECLQFPADDDRAVYELIEGLRARFGKWQVTEEDRIRAESVRASAVRSSAGATTTPEELLAQSEARIEFRWNDPDARAWELVNKTNQFNLNGRRIDEAAWRDMAADPRRFLLTVSYQDKFGPLGKIAVLGGRATEDEVRIDLWVMSCRAFSRRIEHQTLRAVFQRFHAPRLFVDFAPTPRNGPLCDFLRPLFAECNGEPAILHDQFLGVCPTLYSEETTI